MNNTSFKFIINKLLSIDKIYYLDLELLFKNLCNKNYELFIWIYDKFRHIENYFGNGYRLIKFNNNCNISPNVLVFIANSSVGYNTVKCFQYVLDKYKEPIKIDLNFLIYYFNNEISINGNFNYNDLFIKYDLLNKANLDLLLIIAICNDNYNLILFLLSKKVDINRYNYLIKDMTLTKEMMYFLLKHKLYGIPIKQNNRYYKEICTRLVQFYLKYNYSYFDKNLLKIIIGYC